MADVRPFRALRYAPNVDLAAAICPPFDVISPKEQRALHQRSPHNAVRLELAEDGEERYRRAADTLRRWLDAGVLRRDSSPAFYVYRQQFQHGGRTYSRSVLFARLRLEEWEGGVVLPHERTFGAPKDDRLKLLRAARLNTSPVFLLYKDDRRLIQPLLAECMGAPLLVEFSDGEGGGHALWRIDNPRLTHALSRASAGETLYVADGHHRYETALAYRDERRAVAPAWSESEPENFILAALTAADDPGLLVLPIHRLTNADVPVAKALDRLARVFEIEAVPSSPALLAALAERGRLGSAFGLAAAQASELYLLTLRESQVLELMPQEGSAAWRNLDASIATYAVLRYGLGMDEAQMADYSALWFTEDAGEALAAVRDGRCRYALLLNPVPVRRILAVADAGERMPQKSTFFYPKVPTGLVFNPLDG